MGLVLNGVADGRGVGGDWRVSRYHDQTTAADFEHRTVGARGGVLRSITRNRFHGASCWTFAWSIGFSPLTTTVNACLEGIPSAPSTKRRTCYEPLWV